MSALISRNGQARRNQIRRGCLLYTSKNLNRLLAWGHARALENLLQQVECDLAIADQFGDERLILNALQVKGKQIRLVQRTKAESDLAVAAASILARAEFLQRLDRLSQELNTTLPKGCLLYTSQHASRCGQAG